MSNHNDKSNISISIPLKKSDFSSSLYNIGKISDQNLPMGNFALSKHSSSSFKLVNKQLENQSKINKDSKPVPYYLSSLMTDQNAFYLIFKASGNTIEIHPTNNWHSFRKELSIQPITAEEAEERMKKTDKEYLHIKSFFGKQDQAAAKPKGSRANKKLSKNEKLRENNKRLINHIEDEEDEDEKAFAKVKPAKETGYTSDNSQFSKPPSYLNEIPEKAKNNKNFTELKKDLENMFSQEDDSSDPLIDENPTSNLTDNFEEKFNELERDEKNEMKLLGQKRDRDNSNKIRGSLDENVNKILSRHRSISYDNIVKELKHNFTINEIDSNLNLILDKKCSKFKNSDGSILYIKKINK